ncbi:Autophagy-related protein 101, partial [Dillenia turbinata]
ILHSIFFHRALGLVPPKDIDLELFKITYISDAQILGTIIRFCLRVQCGDVDHEKKIDEKIDQFIGWVEKHPDKKSQVCYLVSLLWTFTVTEVENFPWLRLHSFNLFTFGLKKFGSFQVKDIFATWQICLSFYEVTQHVKVHSNRSHHSKPVVDSGVEFWVSEEGHTILFKVKVAIQINGGKVENDSNATRHGRISFVANWSSSESGFGMDVLKRMLQTGSNYAELMVGAPSTV